MRGSEGRQGERNPAVDGFAGSCDIGRVTDVDKPANPSLRLLVVEFDREAAAPLTDLHGDIIDVRTAGRAAEAVRAFDTDCPDAVVITIGHKAEKSAALVSALRERPLGALVPLLVVDGGKANGHPIITRDGALETGADRFFGRGTPATHIVTAAAELLGIALEISDQTALAASETAAAIADALERDTTSSAGSAPTGEFAPVPVLPPSKEPLAPLPPVEAGAELAALGRTPRPVEPSSTAVVRTEAAASPPEVQQVQVMQSPVRAPTHPTPRFDPARNPKQAAPASADAIVRKLRQTRHEDYFTILEVRKGSDPRAIEGSYERLRQRFDPAHVSRPVSDRLHTELAEICDTLDDAFAVLSDAGLREGYLRAILSD